MITYEEKVKKFGENFRKEIEKSGVTAADIAKKLGYDEKFMEKLIETPQNIDSNDLLKITTELNIPETGLFKF